VKQLLRLSSSLFVGAALLWCSGRASTEPASTESASTAAFTRTLTSIERQLGGRVGVSVADSQTGRRLAYRADERFPLNSTFKVFACGQLLSKVDRGTERLDRTVTVRKADLVTHSPVTAEQVGAQGMTLSALCQAAMTMSDNTAANLILDRLGGPQALTAFMRSIGDHDTQLNRRETQLNEGLPGDRRDTTTPAAAARSLSALTLGTTLNKASRARLERWLTGNQVGGPLLRASLPAGWRIGDRTGAGGYGSRSVVAVIWPPNRQPVTVAVYLTQTQATLEQRNAAIATIGKALVKWLEQGD
jgi:beta-lactamase class A